MRLFTLRGPVIRMPWPLVILGWVGLRAWQAAGWLAAYPAALAVLAVAGALWWAVHAGWWPWLLLACGLAVIGTGVAMELQPAWWRKVSTEWASWRRLRWYRKRWEPAMVGAGLTLGDDLPQLTGHRFGGQPGERDLDVLTVVTVPGQVLEDWRTVAPRLAAAWGRTRVRVHVDRYGDEAPRKVTLYCSSRPVPTVAAARRAAVAGGQSTTMHKPVDDAPSGAFPRRPR